MPLTLQVRGMTHVVKGLHDCQVTFRIVTLYLEGHGDLVSRLVARITTAIMWVIGAINLLAKCP